MSDPERFPDIKGLADSLHNMGLKFGLSACGGTQTCKGYPGSLGKETIDA